MSCKLVWSPSACQKKIGAPPWPHSRSSSSASPAETTAPGDSRAHWRTDEPARCLCDVLCVDAGRGQELVRLPRVGHLAHRQLHDAWALFRSAKAASTASPIPPSGQWSSTVTIRPPVASAAARSVVRVDRLDRVEVDHPGARCPSCAERVGGLERLVHRDPGGDDRRPRRRSDERTTLLPPTGNSSSAP